MNKVAVGAVNHQGLWLSRQVNQWRVKAVVGDRLGEEEKQRLAAVIHGWRLAGKFQSEPIWRRPQPVATSEAIAKLELDAASPLGKHRNARQASRYNAALQQIIRSGSVRVGLAPWRRTLIVFPSFKRQHSLPGIMDPAAERGARHSCFLSLQSSELL